MVIEGEWGEAPLNTKEAAEWLQQRLPEKGDYWTWFLINNRRAGRKPPHRIPFARQRGQVVYPKRELEKFLTFEQSRRVGASKLTGQAAQVMAAFALGSDSGGPWGRRLHPYCVKRHEGPKPFVQLIIEEPLAVYRLSVAEAKKLAAQLTDACEGQDTDHG